MGKVKVTQEQANAIEAIKVEHNMTGNKFDSDVEAVRIHADLSQSYTGSHKSLNGMFLDPFIRALYIGYEVKPEFKQGDIIYRLSDDDYYEVLEVRDSGVVLDDVQTRLTPANQEVGATCFSDIRHATPEETTTIKKVRWWANHGRGDWELRKHDVLTHKERAGNYVVLGVVGSTVRFYGLFDCRPLQVVKDNFKVKYFAEDRKDIKGDK